MCLNLEGHHVLQSLHSLTSTLERFNLLTSLQFWMMAAWPPRPRVQRENRGERLLCFSHYSQ